MKHTDFYKEYKALDDLERAELIEAVKAHGGEYVFSEDSKPCVIGSFKHCDTAQYYVTKVTVDKDDWLTIYGYPTEYWDDGEDEIVFVEFGHIGFITDHIPETEGVKEVSDVGVKKEEFVWTQDAIINLQYITMYGEIWGGEHNEMRGSWDMRFEKYRKMAIEFSKDELDWDQSDVDYETAIEAFCKRELGF